MRRWRKVEGVEGSKEIGLNAYLNLVSKVNEHDPAWLLLSTSTV
jgi:hypothetical protein